MTATAAGDKLPFTWRIHGSSGTRELTRVRLTVQPGPVKDGKVEVELGLLLLDPEQKVTAVRVRAVRAADAPQDRVRDTLTGGEVVELKVDGFQARGTVTLKADKPETVPYLFQATVVGPNRAGPAAPVAADVYFDPAASGLAGRWTGEVDGLTEVWTVRCVDGKWELTAV